MAGLGSSTNNVSDIVTVAAVTAFMDAPTVDKCFDVGMVECLNKPVNHGELGMLISYYVDTK